MHQRKTWDLCDLSLPHSQAPSLTNIDANSSRSNTRYKSFLASLCSVCQPCTAGWRDGSEAAAAPLLPAGWEQLAAGQRVCHLSRHQLAEATCLWKRTCYRNQADDALVFCFCFFRKRSGSILTRSLFKKQHRLYFFILSLRYNISKSDVKVMGSLE